MLRLRNSGGHAGFRRAQNTAPSAPLAPFVGREGTPPPVFAGGWFARCKTVAEQLGSYAHVEIFNRAWQAFEACLAVWREFTCVGHAWRAARSSCSADALPSQGAPDPVLPTKTNPPPDGQERFASLPSPCIDLHASRATGAFSQRSYGQFSFLLQKQAEECPLAPKKIL